MLDIKWSEQYGTCAVVIPSDGATFKDVIECAEETGATTFEGGEKVYVVAYEGEGHGFPECFSESALRSDLK